MRELTEQEHDELVNAEFTVVSFRGFPVGQPENIPGRLVEIDSDIGVTIINKEDTNDYLFCIIGPAGGKENAEEWKKYPGVYDELFQWVVDSIKSGIIDLTDHSISIKAGLRDGDSPSSEFCVFNR